MNSLRFRGNLQTRFENIAIFSPRGMAKSTTSLKLAITQVTQNEINFAGNF